VVGLYGVVVDLVVVALVADGGCELGVVLEAVFPIVVEDGVEFLAIGLDSGGDRGGLRGEAVGSRKAATANGTMKDERTGVLGGGMFLLLSVEDLGSMGVVAG